MRFSSLATITAAFVTLVAGAQAQFLTSTHYDDGTNLSVFVHADVNNDGKTDVVGFSPGEITVLLGTGTGGFGSPIRTKLSGVDPSSSSSSPFVLGDFNGDGRVDFAFFGKDHVTGQNAIAVMFGNGNGTFQTGVETVLGSLTPVGTLQSCGANAGDYNGDGKLDIVYPSGTEFVFLHGNGNGTFAAPVTSSTGSAAFSCLATGDFNNDGKLDLAAATSGGTVAMLLGNGNGTFQSPFGLGGPGGSSIVAAELDGNTNLDLVAATPGAPPGNPGRVTVYLGNGTGHFPTTHTYKAPGLAVGSPLVVRDLNGDHAADIAYIGVTGFDDAIVILLNNGAGSFTPGKLYAGDGAGVAGLGQAGFLAADLNGDGKVDLAFPNPAGGISVMVGNGNGTFQGNLATISFGGGSPIVAKFTSSSAPDVLFTAPSSSTLLLSNGDGTFSTKTTGCNFGSVAGDFNGDGKLDLAGNTSLSGVPAIGVCLGNGDGTFTETSGHFDQGISHGLLAAGDFNNDGKLDLAASDANGVSILLGNGDGSFQSGVPTAVNQSKPNFVLADFNGDGKLDFAAITGSGISVFLGKGDGTFESPLVSTCSCNNAPGSISVVDVNKDGKLDLVVVSGGNAIVLLGKGNGTFQAPARFALSQGAVTGAAIADFNGDGKLDIAVGIVNFDSGEREGVIAVLFGDGTGKFSAPTFFNDQGTLVQSGLATADFNGDGKPDLVYSVDGIVVTYLNQE
jgi:hypothetical protein